MTTSIKSRQFSLLIGTILALVLFSETFVLHTKINFHAKVPGLETATFRAHPQEEEDTTGVATALPTVKKKKKNNITNTQSFNYKFFDEPPRPFFSSCLLVKDENHRLPEWIAYHYYQLPLRHLVLMVDPSSQTLPNQIIERWKPYLMIEVWSDKEIGFDTPPASMSEGHLLTKVHFSRQRLFYQKCAFHLRRFNRTWVTFHDADEYLYLDPNEIPDALERMARPGSIQQFIHDVHRNDTNPGVFVPGIRFPRPYYDRPCIMVARTYFGATESTPEIVQRLVPSCLNGSNFETLRHLHRGRHDDFDLNGRGKSLVHVSSPPRLEMNDKGIHSILKKVCRPPRSSHSPIRIRHFLGSWEAHSSRLDPRMGSHARNLEYYEYRSQLGKDDKPDDDVRQWLFGFCSQMNNDSSLVSYLLEGAGQLPPAPYSKESVDAKWSLSPFVIEERIDREGHKVGSFGHYLKQNYDVETLHNGTLVARRKTTTLP